MQKVIQWRLRELLKQEGITVLSLAAAMPGTNTEKSRQTQLYTITSPNPDKRPKGTDFEFANSILEGLKKVKGREFNLSELIVYQPDGAA